MFFLEVGPVYSLTKGSKVKGPTRQRDLIATNRGRKKSEGRGRGWVTYLCFDLKVQGRVLCDGDWKVFLC